MAKSNAANPDAANTEASGTESANTEARHETATLAGGCFWCLEAVFAELRGVVSVRSGYMGGAPADPSYDDVCSGRTGHAEVVSIAFDPARIPYRDLLEVFFAFHDPTTLNRQGNDIGTQYRSAIFCHSEAQRAAALETIARLEQQRLWDAPIVTEVVPASAFYAAEGYHQRYFERNPHAPYCAAVIAPKLQKFRRHFLARFGR